ncbi:MAG: hypothetical protein AAF804_10435, partial [Bacteroidota bacterium]
DLFDAMVKALCVEINNHELTKELVSELEQLFTRYKGNKDLQFRIRDPRYMADIQMVSSDWKVAPDGDLVRELEEMGIGYSLK